MSRPMLSNQLAATLLVATFLPVPPAGADTLLVANKSEATLSLLDLDTGEVVATLPTGAGPHEVAVSPDGATAVVANYGGRGAPGSTLTVVDVPGARVLKTVDLGEYRRPHGILFLPDGRRVVVTAEENQALVTVDLESGQVAGAVETGQQVSHMVALSRDGARAYVANIGSGSITAIDLAAGKRLGTVATGDGAEGICVTSGGQVWVANRGADTVSLVDPESLQVVATLESASFPIRAEATPDGAHVLVTNARSGSLTVIDTQQRKVARTVDLKLHAKDTEGRLFGDQFGVSSTPIGIEIAPDGRRAYIAHAGADVIQIVDLTTWEPAGVLEAGKEPDGMGYSTARVRPGGGA